MPTIHTLGSIKIDVYSRDHLPPHVHAIYAEREALIIIRTLGYTQEVYLLHNLKQY